MRLTGQIGMGGGVLRSESRILKQPEEEKKRPKCVAKKRPSLAWGNMSVDADVGGWGGRKRGSAGG